MSLENTFPRWQAISREERYYTARLYEALRHNPRPAWSLLHSRLSLKGSKVADVGYEVCFFRDMAKAGLIDRQLHLEKLTFDLVLTLEPLAIILIEAKAQQGFGIRQLNNLECARKLIVEDSRLPIGTVRLVGLCSSRCHPRPSTRSRFDAMLSWSEIAREYEDNTDVFDRADALYRC